MWTWRETLKFQGQFNGDVLNKVLNNIWMDLKGGNGDREDLKLAHNRKIDKMSADFATELDGEEVDVDDVCAKGDCDLNTESKPKMIRM